MARCEVYNKEINYVGRGWKSLEQHLKKKLHIDNLKIKGLTIVCLLCIIAFLSYYLFCKEVCSFRNKETCPNLIAFLSLSKLYGLGL